MKFGEKDDRKAKKVSIGKLRKTQLITTFGTGAIAEMPEYTVIMAATDYWDGRSPKIYESNLQRLLGMKYFKEPYATESQNPRGNGDIPAFRFPRMHFCPKCGRLDDYKSFGDTKYKKCISCNRELVPSRFVTACENGHIEDFPFEWWVHYGNPSGCKDPSNHHKLVIEFKNTTGGLASIVVKCNKCGKTRSMEGCMNPNALKGYNCRGRRPWIGFSTETNDPEKCQAQMRTLQRGASNAYYSITQSALTIPPWSSKIQTLLDEKWETFQNAFDNGIDDATLGMLIGALYKTIIDEGKYTVKDFISEINKRRGLGADPESPFTEHTMYEDEYKALCAGYITENDEPEQFEAEITEISSFLQDYFDEVVLVKRLREVMALKGFRRVTPALSDEELRKKEEEGITNEFTPVWSKQQSWLPAIEMRGEGIFIVLNQERLSKWEETIGERYDEMKARLGNSNIGKGMFSARYVLLHTLSHLLIRQLTIDCGYQEAALKERIYSKYSDSNLDMAGILIYTSASDSDGSLGGLVRQGEADLLETTVRNMLQEASWCSSDPLCIDSKSQGYNSLNYSACHACTLLPETSCEARNCLLDRAAVVGKPDDRSLGFFGDLLKGGKFNVENDSTGN